MVSFALLNRGRIVTETMPSVARKRWTTFVMGLKLEDRVEFGEEIWVWPVASRFSSRRVPM